MRVEEGCATYRNLIEVGQDLFKILSRIERAQNSDITIVHPKVQHTASSGAEKSGPISFKEAKSIEKESGGSLYTREARFVEYKDDVYRVKNPFYSNYVAAEEVIMGSLFKMSGLDAPAMLLCNNCEDFFSFNDKTRADFTAEAALSGFACVASRLEPSYRDLGSFLLDANVMEKLIGTSGFHESESSVNQRLVQYEALVNTHQESDRRLGEIYTKYPGNSHRVFPDVLASVKKENLIKFDALESLNKLLPPDLVEEQQKHFFASRLINNWDYLNFSFCNFGYFLPDASDEGQFKGMTVDFGGSGTLGFGGYSKTESFERATQGARLENPLESTSLFERSDSTFSSDLPSSLTSISTIPRSRPLLSTVKDVIRKEAELYDVKGSALFEKNFGPALEVAYRMAVLPDEAVEKYLTDHWIMGAADFPYRDKNNENNLSVAQISKVMKDRKEAFIGHFGFESIKRWEENNPLQAVKVRNEIEKNLGELVKGFSVSPISNRSHTV